ncbi:MAG TPA: PKD domain-containing protein, partial [Miltoncostaea sp.]|nr:PKD domain-containing protein [Miltoncostaea sp.]
ARASTAFTRPGEDVTFTAGAPAAATVKWTFPDGRVMTGAKVTRSFKAGAVTARVVARMPDGLELTTTVTVIVDGSVPKIDAKMVGSRLRVVPEDLTGLASLTARIDQGPTRTVRGRSLPIPEGKHVVTLTAKDAAGNARSMKVTAIVDTRGPTVTARASTRPGAAQGKVQWSVRDSASGPGGARVNEGRAMGARGTTGVPAGRVATLVASDRFGNITRLAAPVPAPIRLGGMRDPGLQGKLGDRLLPGGGPRIGIQAVVLTEARSRMVWAGVLRGTAGSGRYDGAVTSAVKRFQALRHVREPAGKGTLGPATLRAMDLLARWGGWGASAGRG